MTIAERHKYILETLNRDGFIRVIDIAEDMNVTVVTVRRDLKVLEDKGQLFRTHGGASPVNPQMTDRHIIEKAQIKTDEKRLIGIAAAKLIDENDTIIINSGSTVYSFAEQLQAKGTLTVVSASLSSSILLGSKENINILQLGGNFRGRSISVVGSYASSYFQNVACSKLFLGIDGIDEGFGVTTSNIEEAELNRAMMANALKTIILCDSSKFGRQGFGRICKLDKIDLVITDSGISNSAREMLEKNGVKLIIA